MHVGHQVDVRGSDHERLVCKLRKPRTIFFLGGKKSLHLAVCNAQRVTLSIYQRWNPDVWAQSVVLLEMFEGL
jgi:hypothetical protein